MVLYGPYLGSNLRFDPKKDKKDVEIVSIQIQVVSMNLVTHVVTHIKIGHHIQCMKSVLKDKNRSLGLF